MAIGTPQIFQSKQACFAVSQIELFGELEVARFDGVFGSRHMWASKGEIFVILCGVNLNAIRIYLNLRFSVGIKHSNTPIDLRLFTGAKRSFMLFEWQKT